MHDCHAFDELQPTAAAALLIIDSKSNELSVSHNPHMSLLSEIPMFLRMINQCADWLAMMLDEPECGSEGASQLSRSLQFVAASLALASGVVALTTLTTLAIDALLHTQFAVSLVR
jgi:hypothetical protein